MTHRRVPPPGAGYYPCAIVPGEAQVSSPPDIGAPPDVGAADPRLAAALSAWEADPTSETAARVHAALLEVRLLIPVVATLVPADEPSEQDQDQEPASAEDAQMSVPTIIGGDGRVALPAFTSLDALARWREEARPVPVPASEALQAVLTEGCSALLLDVGGPVSFVIEGQALEDLTAGYLPVVASDESTLATRTVAGGLPVVASAVPPDPQALEGICAALSQEWLVAEAFLLAPADGPDGSGLTVGLVLFDEIESSEVVSMVRRVARALSGAPFVAGGLDIAVLTPDQRRQARAMGPPAYSAGLEASPFAP